MNDARNVLIKLVVTIIILFLANWIFAGVNYLWWHILIVGVVLTGLGYALEKYILKDQTIWIMTAIDFVGAWLIVFLSRYVFAAATITFWGAVWTALILAIAGYVQHKYLVESGATKKDSE